MKSADDHHARNETQDGKLGKGDTVDQLHPGTSDIRDGDGKLIGICFAWTANGARWEHWCMRESLDPSTTTGVTTRCFKKIQLENNALKTIDGFKDYCEERREEFCVNMGESVTLSCTQWKRGPTRSFNHSC